VEKLSPKRPQLFVIKNISQQKSQCISCYFFLYKRIYR